jgi:hypothetical protein
MAAEKRLVLLAWDTWAGESTSRIWLFDQLKFRGR